MDTLILLACFCTLLLFRKRPESRSGPVLFWAAWLATVLLFSYHSTSDLGLSF